MKRAVEATSTQAAMPAPAVMATGEHTQTTDPRNDPMRRFVPTPYTACLPVMGSTVRLETNNSKLLEHMVELFARYPGAASGHSTFLWRIVVDSDIQVGQPWPRRSAFSGDGLRFAHFGQRNFLAVDIEVREGLGVVSESLIEDKLGLTSPFLDNLFCLTVGALELVPLWANCVAREHKGVLLFGGANNGKTSASYAAEKLGLNFHADEGAFVELDAGVLRSWGGFWPPTFRPEALQFFPDLKDRTNPCLHRDFVVYHLVKQRAGSSWGSSIRPLCCLFLERQVSDVPNISRVAHHDLAKLLAESVLFRDDECFREQQATVLQALEELPAYVLRYGSDPAVAAATIRDLLAAQDHSDPGRELLGTHSIPR
jgi:hypothetical protein